MDSEYQPRLFEVRQCCKIEGCKKAIDSRGWCSIHYRRWCRHGDPCYIDPDKIPSDPTATEKRCAECGEIKPLEAFYRKRSRRDGRNAQCKACVAPGLAEYARNHKEQMNAYGRNHREKYKELYLAREQAYRDANRELVRSRSREFARTEWARKKQAEWRAANPEKFAEYCRKHYERNKEYYAEYARRWWQANPEKVTANNHRRRARKLAAGGEVTAAEWRAILEAAEGRCYWCEAPCESLQMDHYLPLVLGGPHSPENIVAACQTCNFRKGSKHPDDWRKQLQQERGGELL